MTDSENLGITDHSLHAPTFPLGAPVIRIDSLKAVIIHEFSLANSTIMMQINGPKKSRILESFNGIDVDATLKFNISIGRSKDFQIFSSSHGRFVDARLLNTTKTHARFSRRGIGEAESNFMSSK